MSLINAVLYSFNRGLVSVLALARIDLKRLALSAETMTNWISRSLGSMMLRPGMQYIGTTLSNAQAVHIPFIFSTSTTAILELTNLTMRVRVSDSVVQRGSVSTAITNGTFDTDLTGWTDADESGATSAWATGGYMSLIGTKYNAAIRRQQVTVGVADQGDEHALKIIVHRGNVTIRVGSSSGGEQYIADKTLRPGYHSLAFTPTGDFHLQFSNRTEYAALLNSVAVEASGDMSLVTPWPTADLDLIRWRQSADVIFVAANGYQWYRIERQASDSRSWSVVKYIPEDGPFRTVNTTTASITASATFGDVTLTASRSIFKSTHVGALYRMTSIGQREDASVSGAGQWSDSIRVTGVGSSRQISIDISGTWVGTLTLQRSLGEVGSWTDVTTYSSNTTTTYTDSLDNQVVFYRLGFDTGDYTSGTAVLLLQYSSGGITGVAMITAFTSGTSVSAAVLKDLGSTTATEDWSESVFSDYRGWPGAVTLYEGRLGWHGKGWTVHSVSDAYESFDDQIEGDSAPIIRQIATSTDDNVNWGLELQRNILGTDSEELSLRSTSFDETLTPTNFNIKSASTQGSFGAPAVKIDSRGIYIQRSGSKLYELAYDFNSNDYASSDLAILIPEIGGDGFIRLAVQRQPDTRIHALRSDGTGALLLYNPAEELKCWLDVETDGIIEDVFVMPNTSGEEDSVYYCVKRTINSSTVRYLEKWAFESDCVGATLNKQADSFATFTNSPAAASVPAATASHLVGESVVVWADGKCLRDSSDNIATFTVAANGGIAALTNGGSSYTATTGVVGLPYTAQYKSTKLAYAANLGTALTMTKRVTNVGFILADTHHRGLKFGPDFTTMDTIPQTINGAVIATDTIHANLDLSKVPFPGGLSNDSRLCMEANAPRPVKVAAAVLSLVTDDFTQ